MEKIKTILDREPLSSNHIRSKQDFANVVNGAKGLGKPFWQTNWFYGTVGVAAVAIVVTAVTLSNSEDPVETPENNAAVVALNDSDDSESNREVVSTTENDAAEKEKEPEKKSEDLASTEKAQNTEASPVEASSSQVDIEKKDEATPTNFRTKPEAETKPETVEIGLPNLAGVTSGPIAFKDFCDPLGIQVDDGVMIYQYTLQYRSCARDFTARIGGNKLPPQVCQEIADCGSPIEVTFSNFIATNRDGEPVKLKQFSLVTVP